MHNLKYLSLYCDALNSLTEVRIDRSTDNELPLILLELQETGTKRCKFRQLLSVKLKVLWYPKCTKLK